MVASSPSLMSSNCFFDTFNIFDDVVLIMSGWTFVVIKDQIGLRTSAAVLYLLAGNTSAHCRSSGDNTFMR